MPTVYHVVGIAGAHEEEEFFRQKQSAVKKARQLAAELPAGGDVYVFKLMGPSDKAAFVHALNRSDDWIEQHEEIMHEPTKGAEVPQASSAGGGELRWDPHRGGMRMSDEEFARGGAQ